MERMSEITSYEHMLARINHETSNDHKGGMGPNVLYINFLYYMLAILSVDLYVYFLI